MKLTVSTCITYPYDSIKHFNKARYEAFLPFCYCLRKGQSSYPPRHLYAYHHQRGVPEMHRFLRSQHQRIQATFLQISRACFLYRLISVSNLIPYDFHKPCKLQYAYTASTSSPSQIAKHTSGSSPGFNAFLWLPDVVCNDIHSI